MPDKTYLSRDEFSTLRASTAAMLQPGDRWFNPGLGGAYSTYGDGSVSLIGHTPQMDGYVFTCIRRDHDTITAQRCDGTILTGEVPPDQTVLLFPAP